MGKAEAEAKATAGADAKHVKGQELSQAELDDVMFGDLDGLPSDLRAEVEAMRVAFSAAGVW